MTYKVLGQAAGTGALAPLYAPAAGRQAVTSTLVVLNRLKDPAADPVQVRVTIAPAGANDADVHTVFDQSLASGERVAITEGWTLGPTDLVRVNAPASVVTHLYGSESAA